MFVTARNEAFSKALFFSGDRGGDLGQLKTLDIDCFPDDNGFLFNHIWGKTLRDGACNLPNSAESRNFLVQTIEIECRGLKLN